MKRILAAIIISASLFACAQNEKKESDTTTESSNSTTKENSVSEREKEIADSTKLLDKKLADPNDPTTPDSLK